MSQSLTPDLDANEMLARIASPDYAILSKFLNTSDGEKQFYKGPIVKAALNYKAQVNQKINEARKNLLETNGIAASDEQIKAAINEAIDRGIPAQEPYRWEITGSHSPFAIIGDEIYRHFMNAVNPIFSRIDRAEDKHPGTFGRGLAGAGTMLTWAGGMALGFTTASHILAIAAMGAIYAWKKYDQSEFMSDAEFLEKNGHPVEVELLSHIGKYGKKHVSSEPSIDFIFLARASLTAQLGSEEAADRQLGVIDREFQRYSMNYYEHRVKSFGIVMDTLSRNCELYLKDKKGNSHLIASDKGGEFVVHNQEAYDYLMNIQANPELANPDSKAGQAMRQHHEQEEDLSPTM